jgi:hypothetical protein
VFFQNYQSWWILGINELFFYRKFGRISPWSIDRVHDVGSTSPRTLIKSESSANRSTTQIKTHERVSDNPRVTRVNRYRRSGSPNSTRSSPTTSWWRGDLDSLTLGRQQVAVAAGDDEVSRLASGVVTGKLWCSSSEDEGTKGGCDLRWSFLDGRFGMGSDTLVRRRASHGG